MSKHPGRKPADLIAAGKRPEGRQVIWEAIRRLKTFTTLQLEGETRIKEPTIRTYVLGLERAGHLRMIGIKENHPSHGRYKPAEWTLIKDVGVEAPRVTKQGTRVTQGAGRDNMWRGMKILGDFDAAELAGVASVNGVSVSLADAKHYCKYLEKAGYIKKLKNGRPGGPLSRFQFVRSRNTGAQPPMIQRTHQLFDPNLGEVVWPKGGDQ